MLAGRVVDDVFEPTADDSDAGWVTADGMGAFQVTCAIRPRPCLHPLHSTGESRAFYPTICAQFRAFVRAL